MFRVILVTAVVAMVFSGCVGTESPIGKGTLSKPQHDAVKTVKK